MFALAASQVQDGLVVERFAQAVGDIAEVLPESRGQDISFRLEHQAQLAVFVQDLVYGHRTDVGGRFYSEGVEGGLVQLFPHTKIPEYIPEGFVGADFADDFAEVIEGFAEVLGYQVRREGRDMEAGADTLES